jgi:hypothetical protein
MKNVLLFAVSNNHFAYAGGARTALANAETMLRAFGATLFTGTISLVNYFENVSHQFRDANQREKLFR